MSHAVVLVAVECPQDQIKEAVADQMAPFDESGEWFKNGSRWDWYVIGGRYNGFLGGENVINASRIDLDKMRDEQVKDAEENYNLWAQDKERSEPIKEMCYGVKAGENLEQFIRRTVTGNGFPVPYAFLADRNWHEKNRMGWFACPTATECERDGKKVKKCLHWAKYQGKPCSTVTWQESDEQWGERFYDRFIKPLAGKENVWLVAVDFHV